MARKTRTCRSGQRKNYKPFQRETSKKIQFVASILHQPRFAILDEPFSGLDPLNQEKFIEYIKEISARGTTILLSAHQMQLIEKIATKIFLINRGKQIYYGSLSGIFKEYGGKHILDITFKEDALQKLVQNLRGVESFTWENDRNVRITFNHNIDLNIVLSELSQLGGIADITSRKPDLHDIFVQLVKNHQISQIRN
ncbi:MAG: DUF4162 domain-containing protein [Bacteroidales bacterium]|nr:DUF4162 domain-containing protein [Bacteroidales bacterium]